MDAKRLDAFRKVYELGSFSKAGQELFVSQPTISAHVQALERELGVLLFDRTGRSVLPTPAGQALYRHAHEAFEALDRARAEIAMLRETVAGEIILGASTVPGHSILPSLMAEFYRKYPAVRFDLRIADSRAIIDAVAIGSLPMGVVGASEDEPDVSFTPLVDDEVLFVAAPETARNLEPSLEALPNWPWILREAGSGTRKAFAAGLRAVGVDPRALGKVAETQTAEALMACARAGLGVAAVSRFAAAHWLQTGDLVVVPSQGVTIRRRFYLARRTSRAIFPAYVAFAEFLAERVAGTLDGLAGR